MEVLPFGLLIFVAGTLLLANAWAVVDAELAVEAAAREATRAYVEADSAEAAAASAREAATDAMSGMGRDGAHLDLQVGASAYERCAVATAVATYRVPAITIPFIGGLGQGFTVHGRHQEIIDPFAGGLGPENDCGY